MDIWLLDGGKIGRMEYLKDTSRLIDCTELREPFDNSGLFRYMSL